MKKKRKELQLSCPIERKPVKIFILPTTTKEPKTYISSESATFYKEIKKKNNEPIQKQKQLHLQWCKLIIRSMSI